MSETYKYNQSRRQSQEVSTRSKVALAIGIAAIAGLGIKAIERNADPQYPVVNGPHKEYVVKLGDTVSGILAEAYPDRDWRAITDIVEDQLPPEDRENYIVRPGQVISFGTDAEAGKLVDNSTEADSAPVG